MLYDASGLSRLPPDDAKCGVREVISRALTLSLDLMRVEGDQRVALSGMYCFTKL